MTFINGDVVVYYTITFGGKDRSPPNALRLLELDHDFDDTKIPTCSFTFYNRDQRLEDPGLKAFLKDGNLIKFTYGYIDDLSELYTYEMKAFEGFDEVRVICYPYIKNLNTTQSRTWKDKTISDVATLMAGEMGMTPDVQKTTEKYKSLKQENETNPKWLAREADKFHFVFGFDGKTMFWKARNYNVKPTRSFGYRTGNPRDFITFKPKQNTFQIPAGYELSGRNKATGQIETAKGNGDETTRWLLGGSESIMNMGVDGQYTAGRDTSTQGVLIYNRTSGEQRPAG